MKRSAARKTGEIEAPRICLLTETFYPVVGGGETYARLFSRRLIKLGVEVFVLTRRVRPELKPSDDVNGVPVFRLPPTGMVRFGKYAMLPFLAVALIRMRGLYNIIYVSNFRVLGPLAVLVGRLLGKKCVLRGGTCGELSGDYAIAFKATPAIALRALSAPAALRRQVLLLADAFVSISSAITAEFRRCGVPADKIAVLPSGVDTDLFHPVGPEQKRRLRRELGLPEDGFLVGYSGKLNRGKGLDHLVAVWPKILTECPKGHLVFIGSGGNQSLSCEAYLRDFVRTHEFEAGVTFTGYVENVHQYLQCLDVFAFPTENEALGNSLLEAMSCGLPCVASEVGGVPDIVKHDHNGLLVPAGEEPDLASALCTLIAGRNRARELASAARKTIEERFSLDALTLRHRDFFVDLARTSADRQEVGSVG